MKLKNVYCEVQRSNPAFKSLDTYGNWIFCMEFEKHFLWNKKYVNSNYWLIFEINNTLPRIISGAL